MGSSFRRVMFDENVTEGLVNWAEKVRRRTRIPSKTPVDVGNSQVDESSGVAVQITNAHADSLVQ